MAAGPIDVTWLPIAGIAALTTGVVAVAVPIIASATIALFLGWIYLLGDAHGDVRHPASRGIRGLQARADLDVGL